MLLAVRESADLRSSSSASVSTVSFRSVRPSPRSAEISTACTSPPISSSCTPASSRERFVAACPGDTRSYSHTDTVAVTYHRHTDMVTYHRWTPTYGRERFVAACGGPIHSQCSHTGHRPNMLEDRNENPRSLHLQSHKTQWHFQREITKSTMHSHVSESYTTLTYCHSHGHKTSHGRTQNPIQTFTGGSPITQLISSFKCDSTRA